MSASFARALAATDYLRFSPLDGSGRQREWMHFVVHGPEVDLLINFNLVQLGGAARAQTVVLIHDSASGEWDGDVDGAELERDQLGAGRIRLTLGHASLRFDGTFQVELTCRRRPISLQLTLEPRSFPYLAHNVPLEDGVLHWLVAPRMSASGIARWGARTVRFAAAPAYHDHNWGHFAANELAWEWCCALPDGKSRWSAVLVRVLERAGGQVRSHGLLVWDGAHRRRVFRGDELSVTAYGLLRMTRPISVPRALSLLAQGSATSVPERVQLEVTAPGARLVGVLSCRSTARVLVPREGDSGTIAVHEVMGQLQLRGELDGESLAIDAPMVAEFLGEPA